MLRKIRQIQLLFGSLSSSLSLLSRTSRQLELELQELELDELELELKDVEGPLLYETLVFALDIANEGDTLRGCQACIYSILGSTTTIGSNCLKCMLKTTLQR